MSKRLTPNLSLIIFLIIFFVQYIFAVEWSLLNSTQINNLPVEVFKTITANELAQIPPAALKGLKSNQIFELNPAACSGFSADQIGYITSSYFSFFTSQQVEHFTPGACKGINGNQVAQMDGPYKSSCSGLQPECISNLQPLSFGFVKIGCVEKFTADMVKAISAAQLAKMSRNAISGFSEKNIRGLTIACSGMNSAKLAFLDNSETKLACKGISPICISIIDPDQFRYIKASCVQYLSRDAVASISKDQIALMDHYSFEGFNVNMRGLTTSCAGITFGQLDSLTECQYLEPECCMLIEPGLFSQFSKECISKLNLSTISIFSNNQLAQISNNGISGLRNDQLNVLPSCTGLVPDQIEYLNSTTCTGFSSKCLSELSLTTIPKFSAACFSNIPDNSVKGFSSKSISLFETKTLAGFTASQILEFYLAFGLDQFVNVISQKQLDLVPTDSIIGFKSIVESHYLIRNRLISGNELSTLSWLQLSVSTDNSIKNSIKKYNMEYIHPKTIRGLLNISEILDVGIYSTFSIDQLDNLLPDTISSITEFQINTIPPIAFTNPHSFFYFFKSISDSSIPSISIEQLASLNFKKFTIEQVMKCSQFNSLTQNQLGYLRSFPSYYNMLKKCVYNPPIPQPSIKPQPTSSPQLSYLPQPIRSIAPQRSFIAQPTVNSPIPHLSSSLSSNSPSLFIIILLISLLVVSTEH